MQREQYKHVVLNKILDQQKKAEIKKTDKNAKRISR